VLIHVIYFRGFYAVTEILKGYHLEHFSVGRRLILEKDFKKMRRN